MSKVPSLEERLRESSVQFDYPATPAISARVHTRLVANERTHKRRLALRSAVLAIVILFALTLAVPDVRAQVLKFLRIGVVRIFPAPPAPTMGPAPTSLAPVSQIPLTATPMPGYTPPPGPAYLVSMEGLAGETTLEAARKELAFPLRLPTIPVDLGGPDRVFVQENGQMALLVWLDQADPGKVRLSLHEIEPGAVTITKYQPPVLEKTEVNGHEAAWVEGPYIVELADGDMTWRKLVEGKTLIWEEDGITYRLESNLSLEEALRIAESLQ